MLKNIGGWLAKWGKKLIAIVTSKTFVLIVPPIFFLFTFILTERLIAMFFLVIWFFPLIKGIHEEEE